MSQISLPKLNNTFVSVVSSMVHRASRLLQPAAVVLLLALSGHYVVQPALAASNTTSTQTTGHWWLIRPPNNYFEPDVDTTQATPFPRVPPSPYGPAASICPPADGVPYSVGGYPGTPYLKTPFSDLFHEPPILQSNGTVCRTGDADPKHCMKGYELEVTAFQARTFDNAVPACKALPGTWLMGYNGVTPGPTIHHPV